MTAVWYERVKQGLTAAASLFGIKHRDCVVRVRVCNVFENSICACKSMTVKEA